MESLWSRILLLLFSYLKKIDDATSEISKESIRRKCFQYLDSAEKLGKFLVEKESSGGRKKRVKDGGGK